MSKRIGIYAGTFNPVHAGHIAFALQALQTAKLDMVYFLPERQPRYKTGVEHFGHRVAMLRRAAQPHPRFDVLELTDVNFSAERTLPKLKKNFPGDQLVMLMGSDVVANAKDWPKADRLWTDCEVVIGLRHEHNAAGVKQGLSEWPLQPKAVHLFESYAPDVSSGRIREALRRRLPVRGLLASVRQYSNRHWLYVSF